MAEGLQSQEIKAFVITPPEQTLAGVRKLAVLDFASQGDYGTTFSNYLIEDLLESNRGMYALKQGLFGLGQAKEGKTLQEGASTNVFEVIERSRLSTVLAEQRLGTSGVVDESQAASVGKVLGADAMLLGSVSVQNSDQSAQRRRTYRQGDQRVERVVTCTVRQVRVTARFRVVHTETARVLGTAERAAAGEKEACPGDPDLPTVQDMVNGTTRSVASQVADYLAPRFELMEFGMKKVRGNKEFEQLSERAGDLAEDLKVDDAYPLYHSIYEKDSYNPEVVYNLAVLHEVVGNYEEAQEFYGMACQLKEENACKRAMERVGKAVAFREALGQLGVEIKKHEFRVSAEAVAEATAQQVEIQGRREDRISVFEGPTDQAPVVAAVPGGVTFTVLKQEGEWFRIKLLGGKEGYVHQGKVKVKNR
jgi:tetratricopeptide (TPR) repeat protein